MRILIDTKSIPHPKSSAAVLSTVVVVLVDSLLKLLLLLLDWVLYLVFDCNVVLSVLSSFVTITLWIKCLFS